jgi:hypothetical protein
MQSLTVIPFFTFSFLNDPGTTLAFPDHCSLAREIFSHKRISHSLAFESVLETCVAIDRKSPEYSCTKDAGLKDLTSCL